MKTTDTKWVPLVAAAVSVLLFLGSAWFWYELWRESENRVVVEQSLAPIPSEPVTTSTAVTPQPSAVTSTPVKPAVVDPTSTPRTAVSPLTGTLVLQASDVNLNVPYTSQAPERNWSEPWQNACEEAAVLMIDAFTKGYGLSPISSKDELLRLIAWEEAQGWGSSIEANRVQKLFTEYLHYKQKVSIITNPTVAQIKKFLDAGKPVLALANGKTLPNKYYSNGGPDYHAFVIRGYTADQFITNDPGVNRGANFIFPITAVMDSLHDWNGGDVAAGTPIIIVVE